MLLCHVVSFTRQICHIMSYRYDTTKIDTLTMASLRHILMGRNGDYFLNYIDYSKNFDAVLKLLLVI